MADDSGKLKYFADKREACKYGSKCYQKNPTHHQKYKHPPITKKRAGGDIEHYAKKNKVEETEDKITKDDRNIDKTEQEPNVSNNKDIPLVSNAVSESDNSDNEENTDTPKDETKIEENVEQDEKQFIKNKFLVEMPADFYQFWDFCKRIKENNPENALKDVGLTLVGPFDVLAGKFKNRTLSPEKYLTHWRYYKDPPEVQTVLKGDSNAGYHIGYFRDTPEELPVFLCSNSVNKDGIFTLMGENIFAAVNSYLEDLKKTGDPFKKMHIGKIQSLLNKEVDRLKLDLSKKTNRIIEREKKIVTRTFNKLGLVVPFDKKYVENYEKRTEVGYRPLTLGNKELSLLLTKLQNASAEQKVKYLSDLQPTLTFANIATDECDFGTGIELGWNLISHGIECMDSTISDFLSINYNLLKRETFAKIAKAHMMNRRKGTNLSVL